MLDLVSRITPTAWAQLSSGKPPAPETPAHGYVITKPVKGSDIQADYTFVLTRDEIYLPIAVRKPKGNGPVHGYVFINAQPDGSYRPDPMQEKTFEILMSYFDKRLEVESKRTNRVDAPERSGD